uniref:Protein VAC14 homolog n=1 Tax=Neospora caninum (strain Liverpool) TaxID=572307 RepID=A0A0F7UAK1_NEOCL|nr:TPA: Protein VAC14 homolog [Neospora caninum Liverpool]
MFSSAREGASLAPAALEPGKAEVLSPQILRAVGDKNHEKRKAGAQQVETLVRLVVHRKLEIEARLKTCMEEQRPGEGTAERMGEEAREAQTSEDAFWRSQIEAEDAKILQIVSVLNREFLMHVLPNHRKGGLVALASIAIALEAQVEQFLPFLLPPLLRAFSDPEARVRYYACEALYNVLKVAQASALTFLNDIFDGVCKLYGDVDLDVRGGILFVDRLLKEIFVAASNWTGKEEFLLLLVKRCRVKSPFIKLLALSWISLLDSVPDTDMLQHLQLFLESLFELLGDTNRDIRHAADACIAGLLEDVKENGHKTEVTVLASVARIVLRCLRSRDSFSRLTALVWLHALLSLALHPTGPSSFVSSPSSETAKKSLASPRTQHRYADSPRDSAATPAAKQTIEREALSRIRHEDARHEEERDENEDSEDENHRRHVWQLALQRELEPLFPQIVDGVLQCVADREEEIRRLALQNHQHLLFKMLVQGLAFDVRQVVYVLVFHLDLHSPSSAFAASLSPSPVSLAPSPSSSREASRTVRLLCLQWLLLLLLQKGRLIFLEDLDRLLLRAALVALRFAERAGPDAGGVQPHASSVFSASYASPASQFPPAFSARESPSRPAGRDENKHDSPAAVSATEIHAGRDATCDGESAVSGATSPASVPRSSERESRGRGRGRRQRRKSEKEDEEISELALRIIARLTDGGHHVFEKLVDLLLHFFEAERCMMDTRGRVILRHLCDFLEPRTLYEGVAASLAQRTRLIQEAALGREQGEEREQDEGHAAEGDDAEKGLRGFRQRGESAEHEKEGNEMAADKGKPPRGGDGQKEATEDVYCPTEALQFVHQAVQVFNWILLSAPETQSLREEMLRDSEASLFRRLIPAWMHNPVATLALSLRVHQHRLAVALVQRLATVGNLPLQVYVQLDQLVLLFESPAFVSVRLLLLRPQEYPDLVQALVGLSLLLPQNGAYELLHRRLSLLPCSAASCLAPMSPPEQQPVIGEKEIDKDRKAVEEAFVEEACDWFDRLHLLHSVAVSLEDAHAALPASSILGLFLPPTSPSPDDRVASSRTPRGKPMETERQREFGPPCSLRDCGEEKTARREEEEVEEKKAETGKDGKPCPGLPSGREETAQRVRRDTGEAVFSDSLVERRDEETKQEKMIGSGESGAKHKGVDEENGEKTREENDRYSRDGGLGDASETSGERRRIKEKERTLDTCRVVSEYSTLSDVLTLERNDERSLFSGNSPLRHLNSSARERSGSEEKRAG